MYTQNRASHYSPLLKKHHFAPNWKTLGIVVLFDVDDVFPNTEFCAPEFVCCPPAMLLVAPNIDNGFGFVDDASPATFPNGDDPPGTLNVNAPGFSCAPPAAPLINPVVPAVPELPAVAPPPNTLFPVAGNPLGVEEAIPNGLGLVPPKAAKPVGSAALLVPNVNLGGPAGVVVVVVVVIPEAGLEPNADVSPKLNFGVAPVSEGADTAVFVAAGFVPNSDAPWSAAFVPNENMPVDTGGAPAGVVDAPLNAFFPLVMPKLNFGADEAALVGGCPTVPVPLAAEAVVPGYRVSAIRTPARFSRHRPPQAAAGVGRASQTSRREASAMVSLS